MTEQCFICQRNQDEALCNNCKPVECCKCNQNIIINGYSVECAKGCFSLSDYITDFFREVRKASNEKKIKYMGKRSEIIIPDHTSIITVVDNISDLPKNNNLLYGVHCTRNKNKILEDRMIKPESLENVTQRKREVKNQYRGTVRFQAVYGWVQQPEYMPDDYTYSDNVYFAVPYEDAFISSYRYLDWITPDEIITDEPLEITLSEYCTEFLFSPKKVYEVMKVSKLPYSFEKTVNYQVEEVM